MTCSSSPASPGALWLGLLAGLTLLVRRRKR
jgi:MYXO-CTERM domain-containing protein